MLQCGLMIIKINEIPKGELLMSKKIRYLIVLVMIFIPNNINSSNDELKIKLKSQVKIEVKGNNYNVRIK